MEPNNILNQDGTNNESVPVTANLSAQSAISSNSCLAKSKRDKKEHVISVEKPWNEIKLLKKGEVKEDEIKYKSLCSKTRSFDQNEETAHTSTTSNSFHSLSCGNSDSNRSSHQIMLRFNIVSPMNPVDGINIPQSNTASTSTSSGLPTPGGMEMVSYSTMNPYTFLGLPDNPMGEMSNFCPYPMMNGQYNMVKAPVKEVITLSKCVLYPPPPTLDITPRCKRPAGCKTVFLSGLPEKITEEIVREMCERYGEIVSIRISKNFCHIRFSTECSVDRAFFLSGYRIKIENRHDSSHFGRLHVDYAPAVVHYSGHEASILCQNSPIEDTFKAAAHILITWLDRGICNKRNASFFFSMIHNTNSHVHRLVIEKMESVKVLNHAKLMHKQKMAGIAVDLHEIKKVFEASNLRKVWDLFTVEQRKNLQFLKKQTSQVIQAHSKELVADRVEYEFEVRDDEEPTPNPDNSGTSNMHMKEEIMRLREENDVLRNRLRASQQEAIAMQHEKMHKMASVESDCHMAQFKLQTQSEECPKLLKKAPAESDGKSQNYESFIEHSHTNNFSSYNKCRSLPGIVRETESEVRLIALVSTFLSDHPFGASMNNIYRYLVKIDPSINARNVHSLMRKFSTVFKEESTGIGTTLESKWRLSTLKFDAV